jgi:serine protease Do
MSLQCHTFARLKFALFAALLLLPLGLVRGATADDRARQREAPKEVAPSRPPKEVTPTKATDKPAPTKVVAVEKPATPKVEAALPPLTKAFGKVTPESLEELKQIEDRVSAVVQRVMPAVVGVRIGAGQGSGVIITEDGYVLTAAHVSGPAKRKVQIIMPDGRKLKGETLGANTEVDGGLIKILDKGPWPHVDMGKSSSLHRGDWCLALGHPNGYIDGRPPVVRLGRILDNLKSLIRSDCTLVGGDSGGPLFDMDGKVIGIHSRIGSAIIYNIHVPVDTYRKDWDRLVKAEVFPTREGPYLGVQGDGEAKECKVSRVYANSPAEKAGIKEGDVITRLGGKDVHSFDELIGLVARQKIGAQIDVIVRRGDQTLTIPVMIGKRSG